jgi:hypothetical protein
MNELLNSPYGKLLLGCFYHEEGTKLAASGNILD